MVITGQSPDVTLFAVAGSNEKAARSKPLNDFNRRIMEFDCAANTGKVYTDITLMNSEELVLVKRHIIGKDEVKQMTVSMLVDAGIVYMCINETIRKQLQLRPIEKRKGRWANGEVMEYDLVGPIEVRFKNRRCNVDAMVLPGDSEPLLGFLPLEDMDVLIHPYRRELIVNPEHPYFAQMKLKQASVCCRRRSIP